MNDSLYLAGVVAVLTMVSVVNRSFFFLSPRQITFPKLVDRGLRYAPLGALVAVITPEIFLTGNTWSGDLQDPRISAAIAAAGYASWRKRDMLGTILVGMSVLLVLRFGLGW